MLKLSLLAILLVFTIQQDYFLSPLYPPTAFEGQYYQVRFRVRGLDFPHFYFKGLPDCFQGSVDGVVSGIPKGPGSYSVMIIFSSGKNKIQKQVVLRITPSLQSQSTFQSAIITSKSGLTIGYPSTLVYSVGSSIQFTLEAKNGRAPYLWKYNNLPAGLYGDQTGIIRGSFNKQGYYSFNVLCSDSIGISSQVYLTLNIQPKTTIRTTQLVSVQNQHVPLQYDIVQVEKQQVQADNELFAALEIVNKKKQVVAGKKEVLAVATLAVNKATDSLDAAIKAYNISLADRDNAQERVRLAQNGLKAAQQNLNLAIIEQGNSQSWLVQARTAVSDAQKRVAQSQIDLSAAEDKLVDAKNKMRICQENIRTAQTAKEAAQKQYDRAFKDLENARGDLQKAKRRKQLSDMIVQQARDALDLVQQARDNSVSALNEAQNSLKNAERNLVKLLDKLAYIRSLYTDAKTALGEAQWNFETALNKLYIAQARKQTADRASAIALAQGSLSDHNSAYSFSSIGSVSSSFVGCDAAAYPPMSGTVKVTEKFSNGYRVSTGHQILYGSCTQQTSCQVGDTIAYNGFLVNGVVNAKRIERVLLS